MVEMNLVIIDKPHKHTHTHIFSNRAIKRKRFIGSIAIFCSVHDEMEFLIESIWMATGTGTPENEYASDIKSWVRKRFFFNCVPPDMHINYKCFDLQTEFYIFFNRSSNIRVSGITFKTCSINCRIGSNRWKHFANMENPTNHKFQHKLNSIHWSTDTENSVLHCSLYTPCLLELFHRF